MSHSKKQNINIEKVVCIILIILIFISLIFSMFNFAYLFYSNSYINNIDRINRFLLKYNNFMVIDNFLIYFVAVLYMILGIKSKEEVMLNVSFSIFSILTTMIVLILIVNSIAELFGVFGVIFDIKQQMWYN